MRLRSRTTMRGRALRWARRAWSLIGWIMLAGILYWALGWIFWPPR